MKYRQTTDVEFRCGTIGESTKVYPLAMIHDGIIKGTYVEITDNAFKIFSPFQVFLKPDNNQSACPYGTVKTHRFENLGDTAVTNLKF